MKRMFFAFVLLVFSSFAIAAVNINTASKEELDALPGVGPVKAQAIVDYRKANGPFKTIDDLKKVNGIGDATFEKLKSDITVSGRSSAAKAAPAPAAATAKAPASTTTAKAAAPVPATATTAKAKETAPKK